MQTVSNLPTRAELYVRQARVGATDEGARFSYYEALVLVDEPVVRAEGVKAQREGRSSYDCPYRYGTAIGDVWWDGYFAARKERV